ncbi:MAG: TonB family protein [Betaproteobacteria bacterium]|nr:TonB family protein [Betaproteobacteria bacterium]
MKFFWQTKWLATLILALVCGSAVADMAAGLAAYSRGDYLTALTEFRSESKRDNPQALNLIGIMYAEGQGVERDYKLAADWFFKAQVLGSLEAMANLGRMYALGLGVAKDDATALKLLRDAALGGYRPAMLRLADVYEKGELGLAADPAQAKAWRARAGGASGEFYDLRKLPPLRVLPPDEEPAGKAPIPPAPGRKLASRPSSVSQASPGDLLEKQVFERLEKYGKRERKLIVASTDKSPALAAYLEALRIQLKQHSSGEFPVNTRGMTITISVLQDGAVKSVELDRSSGDTKLDRQVISSLRKLGQLPPLPAVTREVADVLVVTAKLPID